MRSSSDVDPSISVNRKVSVSVGESLEIGVAH